MIDPTKPPTEIPAPTPADLWPIFESALTEFETIASNGAFSSQPSEALTRDSVLLGLGLIVTLQAEGMAKEMKKTFQERIGGTCFLVGCIATLADMETEKFNEAIHSAVRRIQLKVEENQKAQAEAASKAFAQSIGVNNN
jgi:hypothetical protein